MPIPQAIVRLNRLTIVLARRRRVRAARAGDHDGAVRHRRPSGDFRTAREPHLSRRHARLAPGRESQRRRRPASDAFQQRAGCDHARRGAARVLLVVPVAGWILAGVSRRSPRSSRCAASASAASYFSNSAKPRPHPRLTPPASVNRTRARPGTRCGTRRPDRTRAANRRKSARRG